MRSWLLGFKDMLSASGKINDNYFFNFREKKHAPWPGLLLGSARGGICQDGEDECNYGSFIGVCMNRSTRNF